jgi:hypothetical protein
LSKITSCLVFELLVIILTGAQFASAQTTSSEQEIIFQQPILSGVAGNFHVPLAEHKYPNDHPFNVILWQPNPNRPDGQLVPSNENVGNLTGFYPTQPLDKHQAAFRNGPGASTVQIEGDTVGVYISSSDLPNGSPGHKMMITPAFMFPHKIRVFEREDRSILCQLNLQVPTAHDFNRTGNFTYVLAEFVFEDRKTKTQISYGVSLFHHNPARVLPPTKQFLRLTEVGPYDAPSHSFQVGNQLALDSRVVTPLAGTTLLQTQPWTGWRVFNFAITQQNFMTALQSLKDKEPIFSGSDNPADYALMEWHLNAELTFASGPAKLGWSLKGAKIAVVPTRELSRAAVN